MPRNLPHNGVGVGVDAEGGPVVDPTANVIALNEAANKRQDDLREAANKYLEAENRHVAAMAELRAEHVEQTAMLRAEHALQLSSAESKRIDSIRQVDVLAVNTRAQEALTAIQALAAGTARDAEVLRSLVTNTATTIAAQTANIVATITERLAALEKSSYEGKGRQGLSDPMMADVLTEMKSLRESRDTGSGRIAGVGASWGVLVGAVGLILSLLSIAGFVAMFLKR
jgi:light-regulated signal transduction histidine kinase (bacteriophytochrome)